jgi:beta-lactamase class A
VRAGDSLWAISQRYGVSLEALARANGLSTGDTLSVGQRLRIPSPGEEAETQPKPRFPRVRNDLPQPVRRPLSTLAPELVEYLRARAGTSAAAVYLPETGKLYVFNPSERFETASIVKVAIMTTQLRERYEEDPNAATGGSDLLVPMITYSDNDAATTLLAQVGGPGAVEAELEARGLSETSINREAWGLSTTTAPDMALLMRSLYYGERLSPALRDVAFQLLSRIVPDQRWGVPAGLPPSAEVAFKGGWLPWGEGWLVHQVGLARLNGETVIFAFLNKGQPSFGYGQRTLERAAELLSERGLAR